MNKGTDKLKRYFKIKKKKTTHAVDDKVENRLLGSEK